MDFSHFSFDRRGRHPEPPPDQDHPDAASMDLSPTSTHLPPLPTRQPTPPPPSCSIGDLAQILDQQSLRIVVPSHKPANEPLTPPSDDDNAFATALREQQPRPRPQLSLSTSTSTARLNSATLRMQRQANVRMQASPAHIQDIASLVEKMVRAEDQCTVHAPPQKQEQAPALPPSPTSEDEGVDMDYRPANASTAIRALLPIHRAADRHDGCTRVAKNARMRRRERAGKRGSR